MMLHIIQLEFSQKFQINAQFLFLFEVIICSYVNSLSKFQVRILLII